MVASTRRKTDLAYPLAETVICNGRLINLYGLYRASQSASNGPINRKRESIRIIVANGYALPFEPTKILDNSTHRVQSQPRFSQCLNRPYF